jgi:hypothetical protein
MASIIPLYLIRDDRREDRAKIAEANVMLDALIENAPNVRRSPAAGYPTIPFESNPNTLQAISVVAGKADRSLDPQEFARRVVDYMHRFRGEDYLQGDDLRRVQRRAATYWQHLKGG